MRDLMSRADPTRTPETRNLASSLATITIIGTTYFALVIVAMHFVRPDINPIDRPTSEYAVGPFGYVMTSAFLSLSVGTWALVLGLRRDQPHRGPLRIGTTFLALWGVGLLVAATFPIDLEGAPQTLPGAIHGINGPLTFLSLTIGMNLVSRGFKSDPRWRQIRRFALALALLRFPSSWLVVSRGLEDGERDSHSDFSFSRSRPGFCSSLLNSALMRSVSAKLPEASISKSAGGVVTRCLGSDRSDEPVD